MFPWKKLLKKDFRRAPLASLELARSYVRSLKLDKLKEGEWHLLLRTGNEAFQAPEEGVKFSTYWGKNLDFDVL